MKIHAFIICALLATSAHAQQYAATVQAVEGVAVFYNAVPVDQFNVCGRVSMAPSKWSTTNKPSKRIEALVRRAKKDYPTAVAIRIDADIEKADVLCR